MSAFVLNRNYQIQFPNSFVDVDREEMEYVDGGGFSIYTFGRSLSNLSTLIGRYFGGSRAWAFANGGQALSYSWGYWTTTSVMGGRVALVVGQLGAMVSGPIGIALGVAAGLGAAGLILYMGTGVRFS